MDPETAYWKRYRAYARQKAGAQMALILLPVLLVVGFGWALSTSGYTAGDPRGDIVWRLSVMVAFDVVYLAMAAFAIRWLLADRRGEKRPRWPEGDQNGPPPA